MNKSPTNVVWIRARNLSQRSFRIVATWLVFCGFQCVWKERRIVGDTQIVRMIRLWEFMRWFMIVVPESVRAKGSSKSGGLLYIFTCSHLHYPHMFTYSHHLIFTSSHLHIVLPSHTHIFTSSHDLIFTSSHHHICTSSHIFCFSLSLDLHLHILTSSYLHILTSSNLHIFYHLLSSSHLRIFSSSHLLSLSCPLSRSLSFFFFSLLRPQAVPTRRHDMATLSHEVRVSKTESVFASSALPRQPFRTKWGSSVNNWGVLQFNILGGNPFARNGVRVSKADSFLRLWLVRRQPFRTKWCLSVNNWRFFREFAWRVCVYKCLCVKVFVCKDFWVQSVCVYNGLCVKASVRKSVSV